MNSSNYCNNDFPADLEFLDAEPLHLSGQGGDASNLDDFDFILGDEDGEQLLADAKGSAGFDCLLSAMDIGSSLNNNDLNMRFDGIQENEEIHNFPSYRPTRRRSQRDRAPSPQQPASFNRQQHFKMTDEVDFDPPAKEVFTTQQYQRQISHSDLSMCSYATSQSCSSSSSTTNAAKQYSDSQYGEALQNLAESMKRSEESRRVVAMMKRRMLTPEQQRALSTTKEQLQKENQQAVQHQSSVMESFISGSRGVLKRGWSRAGSSAW